MELKETVLDAMATARRALRLTYSDSDKPELLAALEKLTDATERIGAMLKQSAPNQQ